jgi:hypothetical protein
MQGHGDRQQRTASQIVNMSDSQNVDSYAFIVQVVE